MDATAHLTLAVQGTLIARPPRSNEGVDWSKTPPIVGAKAWYWDPVNLVATTINTEQESNWRRWPRTNVLGVVLFHRDPAKPGVDYRTIEIGYDYYRVPGLPANVESWSGVWIGDTDWETIKAAMRADTWRPA